MAEFSINCHLNELTSLAKKLGEYEYRFGITSEQIFSNDIKASKSEISLSLRNIIVEWEKYYNEYISKHNQIVLIVDLLAKKNINNLQAQTNTTQPPTSSGFLNQLRINKLPVASTETDEPHYPSARDKCNLTEIRLPFIRAKETILRDGETIQYSYALGFGKIIKKIKDGSSSVIYSGSIDLKLQLKEFVFNLIQIKNRKIVSIPESISYQGHEYSSLNTSYCLHANQEFWDCLTDKINNFFEFEENNALSSYHHLSIFIDETKITESSYIVKYQNSNQKQIGEDKNNLVKLEIPIEVTKFEISEDVYWLEESGTPIEFEWLVDPHGRFGCLGNKIYPITESRANFFSYSFSSRKFYEMNTPEHDLGSIALNNVKVALERLSGVTAWSSPHCSDADVKLKWDLFLKINSTVYPLQIKSSFGKAQKALSEYEKERLPFIPLIVWVNLTKSEDSAKQLVEDLALRFSKILDIPVSSNKNVEVLFLNEERNIKSHFISTEHIKLPILSNYNGKEDVLPSIEHIGTGKKAHRQYKEKLRLTAEAGKWDTETEKILEAIAVRGINSFYKTQNHEIFLKEMTQVKESYLTNNSSMPIKV